jgi:two-component system, sensor histidine kinase and response regulator
MRLLLLLSFLFLPFTLAAQVVERIKELQDSLSLAESYQEKAIILYRISASYRSSDPKLALAYAKEAAPLAKKASNLKLLGSIMSITGTSYYSLGDYDNALVFCFTALRIREGIKDINGLTSSYNNIANIYNVKKDYNKALTYYNKALTLSNQHKNLSVFSSTLINIGNLYLSLDKYDQALAYYQKSLLIKEKLGEREGLIICYINLGLVYTGKKNYALSIHYFNKALPIAEEIGNVIDIIYALRGKAEAHLKTKQYTKAILNAEESLQLAKQSNAKDEIKSCASVLSNIYEAIEDYKNAHKYLTLYAVYNDSITNNSVTDQFAELQVKYETEKKAKANLLLLSKHRLHEEEQTKENMLQLLIVIMVVFVGAVAYVLFKGRQRLRHTYEALIEKNDRINLTNSVLNTQQLELVEQANQLKEQKEELQKISDIKDRLFSVIAHDLRGPLVSLKGLLQLMAIKGIPELKQEELFKSLVKGQQNVLWMLDNLFDWARAQMKGYEVKKQDLDFRNLADENIRLLLPIAISKDIRIENRIPENTIVFADNEMMKLVLRNLISNAIKFCNAGNLVVLSAFTINDVCTVTVQDTGVGMSEDVQQKIFRKSGYSSRGTAQEKGSGLGLSLCKDFIEQNGGTIWAESTLGEGSAFKFKLPAQQVTSVQLHQSQLAFSSGAEA